MATVVSVEQSNTRSAKTDTLLLNTTGERMADALDLLSGGSTSATEPLLRDSTGLRIATAVEKIAGKYDNILNETWEEMSASVQAKWAATKYPVGTQTSVDYTYNDGALSIPIDIVHHCDGSDDNHPLVTLEDGRQVPGMVCMFHRTLPEAISFEPKQAAIVVIGDMEAKTYHFTVKITATWGSGAYSATGSRTYQFTTTNALTAGAQLVFSGDPYNTQLTAMNLTVYNASGTQVESCAITEASGGTDLGTMNDSTPSSNTQTYAKLNNPERAAYGSNRWATSQLRAVLNTNGTVVQGGTEFSRPWSTSWVGQKGILARLPEDFVSVLGKVARTQELHPWDGKGYDSADNYLETTYDYLFPISAREHYFANYLAATTAGYNAEGVVLDYWKALAQASGRTTPWEGWTTYPELITYDAKDTTSPRAVWLRSASRSTRYAYYEGYVNSSGGVNDSSAYASYSVAPAFVIV